ncbi:hypothetical protein SAY86_016835 [Trapa natans]|uniref:Uncharacterized protein n=1 Tax=Trapa natans TaxID=22666 RepID=A0AAN7M496_TRANT|nr:hypothetical protein SAY86_016835 [Trapa natans]
MTAGDQCLILLHGNLYRGPPNGDEKVNGFWLACWGSSQRRLLTEMEEDGLAVMMAHS